MKDQKQKGTKVVLFIIIFIIMVIVFCYLQRNYATAQSTTNEVRFSTEFLLPKTLPITKISPYVSPETAMVPRLEEVNSISGQAIRVELQNVEQIPEIVVSGQAINVETQDITVAETKKPRKTQQKKYLSLKQVRNKMHKKMKVSEPSGLSKKDFVKLMKNMEYDYTGVFDRNSEFIWELAHKYQFNEIFFAGIIADESWWGSSKPALATNNYTSQMNAEGKLKRYSSEKECFRKTAKNLGINYLRKKGKYYNGATIYGVNKIYCAPGVHKDGSKYVYKWADDVYKCMEMIVG